MFGKTPNNFAEVTNINYTFYLMNELFATVSKHVKLVFSYTNMYKFHTILGNVHTTVEIF